MVFYLDDLSPYVIITSNGCANEQALGLPQQTSWFPELSERPDVITKSCFPAPPTQPFPFLGVRYATRS